MVYHKSQFVSPWSSQVYLNILLPRMFPTCRVRYPNIKTSWSWRTTRFEVINHTDSVRKSHVEFVSMTENNFSRNKRKATKGWQLSSKVFKTVTDPLKSFGFLLRTEMDCQKKEAKNCHNRVKWQLLRSAGPTFWGVSTILSRNQNLFNRKHSKQGEKSSLIYVGFVFICLPAST